MTSLVSSALLAAGTAMVSAAAAFLLVRWSAHFGLVAQPRTDRWHKTPIPNTGGVAVFLSCAAGYAVLGRGQYPVLAAAAAGMALLGFLDDRVRLRPWMKLAGQSIAAIVVLSSGVVFRATPSEPFNLALSFLWLVGITNAFNLIDNMDGLCAGVIVIISLFRFGIAYQTGDAAGAALLMILAGAFLGFLALNYKPAKIFMGDCGSMFGGFALAALTVASPTPHAKTLLFALFYPALTFLYPVFDTILVSVLRRAAGRPISVGGRDHSSHRLVSIGLSERKAVWLLWMLTLAGVATGLLVYWMPIGVYVISSLLIIGVCILGVFLATLPNYRLPETAPSRSARVRRVIPTLRAGVIVVVDVLLSGIALLSAFLVRWEDGFLGRPLDQFLFSLPLVMVCHGLVSLALRTFNAGWRWCGIRELLPMGKTAILSAALSICVLWLAGVRDYSRGVLVLYAIFVFCGTAGVRVAMRLLWQTLGSPPMGRRAAILGSGSSGELAVAVLQRRQSLEAYAVVVLENDRGAGAMRINGVPVQYVDSDPTDALKRYKVELLILPEPGELRPDQLQIVNVCLRNGLSVSRLLVSEAPVPSTPTWALAATSNL